MATRTLTNGNDRLWSWIDASLAQDDLIYALGGRDEIYSGDGADEIYGGADNDNLAGGLKDDTIYGEADDDLMMGEEDTDHLYGGTGNDVISGGTGTDFIDGGAGNDILYGDLGAGYVPRGSADLFVFNFAEDGIRRLGWRDLAWREIGLSDFGGSDATPALKVPDLGYSGLNRDLGFPVSIRPRLPVTELDRIHDFEVGVDHLVIQPWWWSRITVSDQADGTHLYANLGSSLHEILLLDVHNFNFGAHVTPYAQPWPV